MSKTYHGSGDPLGGKCCQHDPVKWEPAYIEAPSGTGANITEEQWTAFFKGLNEANNVHKLMERLGLV